VLVEVVGDGLAQTVVDVYFVSEVNVSVPVKSPRLVWPMLVRQVTVTVYGPEKVTAGLTSFP
jgi:hypothetical protein